MNEQPQARRDTELREDCETDAKRRVNYHGLSTGELAGGAAAKPQRVNNVAEQDRDFPNGRDTQTMEESSSTPLFEAGEAETLRTRWTTIQTQFVDEPRRSVEQADELVASAMKRLAEIFANEREGLEHNWDRGDDVLRKKRRLLRKHDNNYPGSFPQQVPRLCVSRLSVGW